MTTSWTDLYRMRWKRRRLILRSLRARSQLARASVKDIPSDGVLAFSTVRNETARLPHWLEHHRALGVQHFLMVDNGSTDGTDAFLASQPDVSVWSTSHSYKASRFGVDWLTCLQFRFGHGRWCLTLDADETLIYPGHETKSLSDLTNWLDSKGARSFGATMLDMYPKGPLTGADHTPGQHPADSLPYFDGSGYTWEWMEPRQIVSIRGGVRKRVFFQDTPDHAPHLHKIPLVRWKRTYAYVSSAHDLLPRRLNTAFDARRGLPTGVLLHSKFLQDAIDRSAEEKQRQEHFTHADRYDDYYDGVIADPDFWYDGSARFEGWEQLERLGLMSRGVGWLDWTAG